MIWGLGFGVWGLRFEVWGLGLCKPAYFSDEFVCGDAGGARETCGLNEYSKSVLILGVEAGDTCGLEDAGTDVVGDG